MAGPARQMGGWAARVCCPVTGIPESAVAVKRQPAFDASLLHLFESHNGSTVVFERLRKLPDQSAGIQVGALGAELESLLVNTALDQLAVPRPMPALCALRAAAAAADLVQVSVLGLPVVQFFLCAQVDGALAAVEPADAQVPAAGSCVHGGIVGIQTPKSRRRGGGPTADGLRRAARKSISGRGTRVKRKRLPPPMVPSAWPWALAAASRRGRGLGCTQRTDRPCHRLRAVRRLAAAQPRTRDKGRTR